MPDNKKSDNKLRNIPSVGIVLNYPAVKELTAIYGFPLITYSVRTVIKRLRQDIIEENKSVSVEEIIHDIKKISRLITGESLKPVINATGIILHTNLGRAPLGRKTADDMVRIITGYSTLEYDCEKAGRSNRNIHLHEIIKYLTSAQDLLIVNNNAAGIYLVLHTFAKGREVIISRGELIEIGGSFRIPAIMEAAGVKMVEVGTTNKTRLEDYKAAINENTALIFKAHKSNFTISGFTEEVLINDLSELAHSHQLPFMYDLGSGLLHKPPNLPLENEPDVKSSLEMGADLVTFSCDKLLGGPQAGIVAGRGDLVSELKHVPLMRVLRVGKLTLAALSSVCRNYLDCNKLVEYTPALTMLQRDRVVLNDLSVALKKKCELLGIPTRIVPGKGKCGGGSLPDLEIESSALELLPFEINGNSKASFAESIFKKLLALDRPIIGILREGKLFFDVLTIFKEDMDYIAESIFKAVNSYVGEQD